MATGKQFICLACGRKTTVTAADTARGSYKCPGCGRTIKILTPSQARSLLKRMARKLRARVSGLKKRAGSSIVRKKA